jgi:hypothetical protein
LRVPGALTYEEKRAQIIKMKQQLGGGNLYHRLGFSFIHGANVENEVRDACKLAREYGVHLGLIFADQSHTRDDFRKIADTDLRLYQWRMDGNDWKGSFAISGNLEIPDDQRDYKIPTPSRLASPLQNYNSSQVALWAESVKRLMAEFPGTIVCINGPIEEELAVGGYSNANKLADYSPYAITEFRDWLRHTGIYDATTGKYAGEGANNLIVGDLLTFNGKLRSQFYDDPTPEDNNGTGVSFNTWFGTNFKSWSMRYWDLDVYKNPITDEAFDCTPESGSGFLSGGFDAPRTVDAKSKFWRAWSYDTNDQGLNYPPGNPLTPAFGFRQNMVRNFVRDLFDVLYQSGLPRKLMYAHQIPGEALSTFTGGSSRVRSSASTIWSGYLEKSQTVGITRFAVIDPNLITQYAGDWGIFEWHTAPNSDPNAQAFYNVSSSALTSYYTHKCHYLFPGWWKNVPDGDLRFPLNDSRFADAIRNFMQAREEVPYQLQGTVHDYSPPIVTGVNGFLENNTLKVNWNGKIWSDLPQKWSDWGRFSNFEIQISPDGITWINAEKATTNQSSQLVTLTAFKLRVRAVSKTGLTGPWSEMISIDKDSKQGLFSLQSEFNTMDPNPELINKFTISLKDVSQVINAESLTVTINGDGNILNTEPENVSSVDKFWPMNSISDLTGIYKLDNPVCADGFFQATVSRLTPIDPYFTLAGSKIDGSKLRYFSLKLYSDVASSGQIFWFITGGNKSVFFDIKKGWNIYSFANLPEWTTQTSINSVRLDPGVTASAKIMLDWFAISSQPISEKMNASPQITNNSATFLTSPTSNPGSYTVTVSLSGIKESITVRTGAATGIGESIANERITLLYPNPATNMITLKLDGYLNVSVKFISANGQTVKHFSLYEAGTHDISVADLPVGMYLVQVNNNKEVRTVKLIKQ